MCLREQTIREKFRCKGWFVRRGDDISVRIVVCLAFSVWCGCESEQLIAIAGNASVVSVQSGGTSAIAQAPSGGVVGLSDTSVTHVQQGGTPSLGGAGGSWVAVSSLTAATERPTTEPSSSPFLCKSIGESCDFGGKPCCSGACSNSGAGQLMCQALDGCRPVGEHCSSGTDCCSRVCSIMTGETVGYCLLAQEGCAPAGEICMPGQTLCCSMRMGGGDSMTPDPFSCAPTVTGVLRCPAGDPKDMCRAEGSLCATGGECCTRFCLPNRERQLVCASGCAKRDEGCMGSRDCCEGICLDGTCQPSDVGCLQLGQRCDQTVPCCSGHCVGAMDTMPGHCMI